MLKRLLVFSAAFLSLAIVAFAQENPPVSDATTSQEAPAPAEKNVAAIEIKGNKAISSNTIISKMKTKVGAPYMDNVISDDLKRLYLLGYFSDIKTDTEDYQGGLKVVITVVERPLIEKITFSGISRLRIVESKLKGSLKSKPTARTTMSAWMSGIQGRESKRRISRKSLSLSLAPSLSARERDLA